jgi:SAM-dependent methyltransferase
VSGRLTEYRRWRSIDYRPTLSELSAEPLAPYLRSGQRALEIGCNCGRTALWLANHGIDTVGIDINSKAILQAREDAKKLSNVKVRFLEGDFLDRFDLGRFDLIVMIRVLTCFPRIDDWHTLLRRCFDGLARDGLLYLHDYVMSPQFESYRKRYIEAERRGWRTGNLAVPGRKGGTLFVAHHHSIEEIAEITHCYQPIFLNFHDSISLNGNSCRMFEFLGKRQDGF